MLDSGDPTEQIARPHADADPKKCGHGTEHREDLVLHRAHAGDERCRRSHDRNESREDNGGGSSTLEVLMRFFEVLLLEELRFLVFEPLHAEVLAQVIVGLVPGHGGKNQQAQCDWQAECTFFRSGIEANGKQQSVARQEGTEHQPRFGEDDQEQDQVSRSSVVGDQVLDVLIQVQEKIKESAHKCAESSYLSNW